MYGVIFNLFHTNNFVIFENMRITIAEYAKWKKVSVQAVTWHLRKNKKLGNPLHTNLPDISAVHKMGRSYELEFNGCKIVYASTKRPHNVLKSKSKI